MIVELGIVFLNDTIELNWGLRVLRGFSGIRARPGGRKSWVLEVLVEPPGIGEIGIFRVVGSIGVYHVPL